MVLSFFDKGGRVLLRRGCRADDCDNGVGLFVVHMLSEMASPVASGLGDKWLSIVKKRAASALLAALSLW